MSEEIRGREETEDINHFDVRFPFGNKLELKTYLDNGSEKERSKGSYVQIAVVVDFNHSRIFITDGEMMHDSLARSANLNISKSENVGAFILFRGLLGGLVIKYRDGRLATSEEREQIIESVQKTLGIE
jgi:hypothetical protein